MYGFPGFIALLGLVLLGVSPAMARDKPDWVLGVFPYVSPAQLASFHTPLKDHLASSLQRTVTLVTAPDFDSFVERTRQGQYDIILTAPHMGRLAETRDGYRRLAMTAHTVQGIFLARKDSPIRKIEDLKGRSIMIAQKTSLIYQMAEQLLRDKGLVPGENVTIIETRTHNNAMHAPLRGEADASVTGTLLWRVFGEEQKGQLRAFAETDEAPGFVLMAHRRLSDQDVEGLKKILLDFHQTPGSEAYFSATGYQRFLKVDDKVMKKMDPHVRMLTPPAAP